MKYEYGYKSAKIFVELFTTDNNQFKKKFNKVVMHKEGKLIDP
jgi:hypothetical protein